MSDVVFPLRPGDKRNSCNFAEIKTALIRNHETKNDGHRPGGRQDGDPEVGCGRAVAQLAVPHQQHDQCSKTSKTRHHRGFWGSWLALVGIASLFLAMSDKQCDSNEAITMAITHKVRGALCCKSLPSNHETSWSDDSRDNPPDMCHVPSKDFSPYEAGALVALEAVYWLQILNTDGEFHRQMEVRRALPLALGTIVVVILTGSPPALAALLGLPWVMSLSMTVFRLYDLWLARRKKQQVCASCQAAGGNMANEELA